MLPFVLLSALVATVAFVVTVLATPVVRRVALARAWTDAPDGQRKLHKQITPSAGGIAIFAGVAAATLMLQGMQLMGLAASPLEPFVYVGAVLIVLLGATDDIKGLGFKTKLAVEIVVAFGLLHAGLRVDLSAIPFVGDDIYLNALYSVPVTILWVVGVMNAVNLIDGIDGLASGVVAIAFASLALAYGLNGHLWLVLVALAFVGALAGFLVHNFNPASIFMGDSGSLFLGYALAVYTLSGPMQENGIVSPVLPLLALGLPLLDTSLSMVRRVVTRRAIMAPDHDHIHHRMSGMMSTRKAVVSLYLLSAVFGLLAVLADSARGSAALIAVGCAAALATGLLIRLGYVRMPYAPPTLEPIPPPAHLQPPARPASDEAAPDGSDPSEPGVAREPGLGELEAVEPPAVTSSA